jgi:acyl carrier protein
MDAGIPKTVGVEDQVVAIIQDWSGKDPGIMDTLGKLWEGKSVPFPVGATNLAGMLNNKLGTHLQGTDFETSTTVDDVIHDVVS